MQEEGRAGALVLAPLLICGTHACGLTTTSDLIMRPCLWIMQAGKEPLPAECIAHPGRKVCNVDKLLAA